MLKLLKSLSSNVPLWGFALVGIIVVGLLVVVIGRAVMPADTTDIDIIDNEPDIIISDGTGGELGGGVISAALPGIGSSGNEHLLIRLSEGQAQPDEVAAIPIAVGEPLTSAEIEQILSRLPALTGSAEDETDFRLPDELLPPPRPGETIEEPFPPPAAPDVPETAVSGPLEVIRFAPEGEIPLAPFLNVTFNQPMVPLATLEQLSALDVPVQLSPEIPGVWKWLGTKTLTFEYTGEVDRFPMATEYTVEVPAGTQSASGNALPEPVTWTFRTPPPTMQSTYPHGDAQPLEPIFFVAFDQNIEQEAVLATTAVTADNQPVSIQLATAAEVEADERVNRLVENAQEGRWLAFRAAQALPADAAITVTIGPGTPSAEGPLLTESAQTYSFRTYAPLRIERHACGWYEEECPPLTPFNIIFNNPIDQDLFTESMVSIDPALPGATVSIQGNRLVIQGVTEGRTTYRVTVAGNVQDTFGQTLGKDETLRFRVGSAPRALSGPDGALVTLDPSTTKPTFSVYSINYDRLHVRAYAVTPSDWGAYMIYQQNFYRDEQLPTPPGRQVMDETISLDAADDALTETPIDLSGVLAGETGHLIVVVEPPSGFFSDEDERRWQTVKTWVQVTQIGLDVFIDHSEMIVWASALTDGAPLNGVNIGYGSIEAVTGADGIARFALPAAGEAILTGRLDEDVAVLPANNSYWDGETWRQQSLSDELRWYVFDDRQMYRPGEEIHLKGWLRHVGGGQTGDVGLIGDKATAVSFTVTGPQGNELADGRAEVNALGGFDLTVTLPENTNLGYASLRLSARGNLSNYRNTDYYHGFQIQEFRRPEFEVSARNETSGPYFVGNQAVVAVTASYFAGGPLPNAEVSWGVSSTPSHYAPPNWPDFTFGTWIPWWYDYGFYDAAEVVYEEEYFYYEEPPGGTYELFTGSTDAAGEHYLQIDFEEMEGIRPFTVIAESTVTDVNRQAWAASTSLLVHPANLYVGLRSERNFVEQGQPLDIEAIVTDLDGIAIAGQSITIRAARLEWKYGRSGWAEEEVEAQECTVTSGSEPVSCSFETSIGGTYQVTATVMDDEGRLNKSEFTRWVSGGRRPPARSVEQEIVTIIPDKESYQPGDVAELLVQAPFSPAEGLLTVSRSGILTTERFQMMGDSHTLQIPIADARIPNLHVQVDLVGSAPRTDDAGETVADVPARPAYATGNLNLNIPPHSRTLSVQVTPQETAVAPGDATTIDVALADAGGQPVANAELAVVVVDEAILALTNYQLADPLAAFYQMRPSLVRGWYGRASIVLANPALLAAQLDETIANAGVVTEGESVADFDYAFAAAPMAEMAEEEAAFDDAGADDRSDAGAQIEVRSNFNPLATFAPAVRTDANGLAQIPVQLPDNLTRYRVMVVAVAGEKQFGSGEANLTARLPLMVRPSAPRFLNFGDSFELPVVLQNQTDGDMSVDVALEAGNLELTGPAGVRVTVPANDRVEVRFPAATSSAGTARFQVAAVSGPYADAATIELPVYTPATTEAFAVYGVIDEGAIAQPVAAPGDVYSQFGGLEITTSSTAVQALTDAVLYLSSYPYGCSEQLASRIMAIAALRDVLTAFEAEGLPAPEALETAVQQDIDRLQGLQNWDGGFPVWRRGRESIPFYSIHVAHALQRAQNKGFTVSAQTQQQALTYLREIESHYPPGYSQQTRWSLSAYALYVRDLMGDRDVVKARNLYSEAGLDGLSLEGLAWLWQVMGSDAAESDVIYRHLLNRAVETAGAANFTTSYGDDTYLMLHSNRRTDGIILDALIANQPDSDLIPKVVNGLLAHRVNGRWRNTQENVFILLALDRYFNTFEAETPDFVARIWLGETYAGDHEFVGRTTERHQTDVPMSYLMDTEATQELILSKDGPGRLYYRLGLRYAPSDLSLEPLDMGFVVQRTYEAVDDPDDVYQDEAGVWHIKAGARVRVRLTMVTNNRRYHVALVDPLPAGLEIVNPALAVSGDIPPDPGTPTPYWWWGTWYRHQNMRDERAEAFTTLLWEGVYQYDYIARATTPGAFIVPPAKAEEMYSPEVFGRSGSDLVIVE